MFRRSREAPAPAQQIGPDTEQIAEPTPIGDALEIALRRGNEAVELRSRAKMAIQQENPSDPLKGEYLEQMASNADTFARKAGDVVLRTLPRDENRYWREARRVTIPRDR